MITQMFDIDSSTFTYLIEDEGTGNAVLIDPVIGMVDEYISMLKAKGLKLQYALETHVHADHITAGGLLKQGLANKTAVSGLCGETSADVKLKDGDVIRFGDQAINVIATPGHTPGSVSFLYRDVVFTGDSLLINGCGRTDFQGGDAATLFESITKKLFTLPDNTTVYPGHDYQGKTFSSIGNEKKSNVRLANKTKAEFIEIMQQLNLPKPKLIDIAVPMNRQCGVPELAQVQG